LDERSIGRIGKVGSVIQEIAANVVASFVVANAAIRKTFDAK